jgi:serine/threonine protein kinase
MAPEQETGDTVDARSDLFAVGAILFEMLAGRPAFAGRTALEILHATLYEQPGALTGSPVVAAVDRVIRRSLAKRPAERPASADSMADELRAVRSVNGDDTPALVHALTRLVVLPFRVLRPDPETDFLAFSLPDAIATSLSGIGSLVVRSSATAARFAGEVPDFKALAAEADVDRVVMGRCCDPATSCGPRPSSSRLRGGRYSHPIRSSHRWAICSGFKTTSRAAWWRRFRSRWRGPWRRPCPTRRRTRAPMSSTSERMSWPAPTTGSCARASCICGAWSWIQPSLPRGLTSVAATA